ncbi:CyP450 monooxygenase [Daedaleopsis nitida]|nr:CyP450 monooxygenase [Daedaleopsis nitida]
MASFTLHDSWDTPTVLLFSFVSAAIVAVLFIRHRRYRLPPGPTPLPLVGNIFDMPRTMDAREYQKFTDQYGDVVYLNVLGQSLVVLGSYETARELLDKRAANYSNRPRSIMKKLIGSDWAFVFDQYNEMWRRRRKEFHRHFGPLAIAQYQNIQEAASRRLLRDLLIAPDSFASHIRFDLGWTVLRIVYGHEALSLHDRYISLAEDAQRITDRAYTPGKYLVEVFPLLQYVPSWLPGAQFKRDAALWTNTMQGTRNEPFDAALEKIVHALPSVVSNMVDRAQSQGGMSSEEDALARDATAMTYFGKSDSFQPSCETFFYAMAANPEVQAKAQAGLDAVVGPNRLPSFKDRDSLPYINALVSECLRWKPVAQLGLPHRSVADDEYRGFVIPGGSLMIPNVWMFSRDPKYYTEPDKFMPERFLHNGRVNTDILNPREYVFGFGRRICPGLHFAEATLFITFASILHTLNIKGKVDKHGRSTLPTSENVKMKEAFLT